MADSATLNVNTLKDYCRKNLTMNSILRPFLYEPPVKLLLFQLLLCLCSANLRKKISSKDHVLLTVYNVHDGHLGLNRLMYTAQRWGRVRGSEAHFCSVVLCNVLIQPWVSYIQIYSVSLDLTDYSQQLASECLFAMSLLTTGIWPPAHIWFLFVGDWNHFQTVNTAKV